jgi:hypothetical protein
LRLRTSSLYIELSHPSYRLPPKSHQFRGIEACNHTNGFSRWVCNQVDAVYGFLVSFIANGPLFDREKIKIRVITAMDNDKKLFAMRETHPFGIPVVPLYLTS